MEPESRMVLREQLDLESTEDLHDIAQDRTATLSERIVAREIIEERARLRVSREGK